MSFVAHRIGHAIIVFLIVSIGLAFMLDLTPGDPAFAILGERATPAQIAQVHEDLRLDDPVLERYGTWMGNLLHGDLGSSYRVRADVSDLLRERMPVTVEIGILAVVMALLISIPAGVYFAYKPETLAAGTWSLVTSALIAFPPFVVAVALVYLIALNTDVLPVTGWSPIEDGVGENIRYALLPSITLAFGLVPQFSRVLRDDMAETLRQDFVVASRARGVRTRRILFRHALRPSSFSLVTLTGTSIGHLIGGAVVVEVFFGLPGVGQLLVNSIIAKDVTTVQGIVALLTIVFVAVNTLVDIAYGYLDPRVRARTAG